MLDPHWNKIDPDPNPGHEHFFTVSLLFSNYVFSFFPLFLCYSLMNHSEIRTFFQISVFPQIFRFKFWEEKIFHCSFWILFCPPDPDPGSQYVVELTDQDPKQCFLPYSICLLPYSICLLPYSICFPPYSISCLTFSICFFTNFCFLLYNLGFLPYFFLPCSFCFLPDSICFLPYSFCFLPHSISFLFF